jgi:hypothetical protein
LPISPLEQGCIAKPAQTGAKAVGHGRAFQMADSQSVFAGILRLIAELRLLAAQVTIEQHRHPLIRGCGGSVFVTINPGDAGEKHSARQTKPQQEGFYETCGSYLRGNGRRHTGPRLRSR